MRVQEAPIGAIGIGLPHRPQQPRAPSRQAPLAPEGLETERGIAEKGGRVRPRRAAP